MNIENHLIFIKDEDKTEQIQYCQYLDGKWKVTYYTSNKTYTYHYRNIKWYKDPIKINPQTHMVYHHNKPIIGAMKIIDFGSYVRIIFKTGYKRIYEKSSIVIEKTCLNNKVSSNCFEYLKRLAHDVSIKNEEGSSFLSR